jgi:KaiC/GvpD/RAD55 family RecA-like ATPase
MAQDRDEDLAREVESLRHEVEQLRETIARLPIAPREGEGPGRIRTFVQGFDEAIEGGIPAGHVVLLAGPSGSMKTSLALSLAHRNHQQGAKVLYVSLEESRESLLRTMSRLGMKGPDDFIVDIGKLRMEHESVEGARDWLQILKDYLARRLEKDRISILVIDPLNSLYSLTDMANPRRDLFLFFAYLRSLGLTTILITESEGAAEFPHHEEFLADGAIVLSYGNAADGRVDLRIRCKKMRHANHARDYFRLEFEGGKFRATPIATG